MHQGFYHVLFLVLKHFWFLHSVFEMCLCEICREEGGKQHPLEESLVQFKACFTSRNSQVRLSTLVGNRLNRWGWTQTEHSTCQRTLSCCKWAAVTCLSGFPQLLFRLSVVFPCQPWAEGVAQSQSQVAGAALGAQHSCEQRFSPCHYKELFVSGLCP